MDDELEDRFAAPQQEGFVPAPKKKKGDGMSDLFRVRDKDITDDMDDVVAVDIEKDILDAGEDGTIEDVVTVTEEDIMGDDLYGQSPLEGASKQRKKRVPKLQYQIPRPIIYPPPMSNIGG